MKVKRGGEREVWWTWEKRGWKLMTNLKKKKKKFKSQISKQENSYTFIASIYI